MNHLHLLMVLSFCKKHLAVACDFEAIMCQPHVMEEPRQI